jgi:hypothetical protein
MDIRKAYTYPFEDREWPSKLGLGVLISIVPILNFAWTGYIVGIMRNVTKGESPVLPGWNDLGKKFMDGLMLWLARLVYSLPALLLICLPVSIMTVPAVLSSNKDMESIIGAIMAAGGMVVLCLSCLLILYALALSVVYPAIYVEFAREGTFASCFQFKKIFARIGKNAGAFFTAWGLYLATGIGSGIAGGIVGVIPCLGQVLLPFVSLAAGVYTLLVYAHLFGQYGMADTSDMIAAVP